MAINSDNRRISRKLTLLIKRIQNDANKKIDKTNKEKNKKIRKCTFIKASALLADRVRRK